MGNCDLCNTDIGPSARRVSASKFKQAVQNGLRPGGVMQSLAFALGVGDSSWVQMALMSPTDWALCSSCFESFDRYYGYKTATYQGRTAEEAELNAKAAMAASPSKKIVSLQLTYQPKQAVALGDGLTLEEAANEAKNGVPSGATDIGPVEVFKSGGQQGVTEFNADDEFTAVNTWNFKRTEISTHTKTKCLVPFRKGFLGIGRRTGVWEVHWTVNFGVKITYMHPAEVTVIYTE